MSDTGFDVVEVLKRLPHRYPLLLVDRLDLSITAGAAKGVSFPEDLADTDDGLRGFAIYDADRYTIFFGC